MIDRDVNNNKDIKDIRNDATCNADEKLRFERLKKILTSIKDMTTDTQPADVMNKYFSDGGKRKEFHDFYDKINDYDHTHLIRARVVADYIASLTDRMAIKKYDEIETSNTKWSKEYSD
jgi:dGTP triphosphohydrolase